MLKLSRVSATNWLSRLGYVGSEGRHLLSILDINQAALGSDGANATRPV